MSKHVAVDYGQNYRALTFKEFPKVVEVPPGGGEECVFNAIYKDIILADKGSPFTIWAVDFFFGHDRGDTFEMHCYVYEEVDGKRGKFIGWRVEENESPQHREAVLPYVLSKPVPASKLQIEVGCRATGPSTIDIREHESYKAAKKGIWRANFDLHIVVIGE